jgi:DNA-binding beta-propeller fold protein YncE
VARGVDFARLDFPLLHRYPRRHLFGEVVFMKAKWLSVSSVVVCLSVALASLGQEGPAPLTGVTSSNKNPLQIAILHWYNANQTASFAVGTGPSGLAFDGASIWVTNAFSDNVTKLRASDGTNLGTFGVGSSPVGVAFDGANIWVTNANGNNVTKLRASDGATLGTFAAGTNPEGGVAFDGANIWVANAGSNTVSKL